MSGKKFTPPVFGKFAKNVKDLFKKKYDYDHQVKFINKAGGGISIESGAVACDAAPLKGFVKAKYADGAWGESELEAWTADSNESKATLKLTRVADGLTLTLTGASRGGATGASLDLEYAQENAALQAVVKSDFRDSKLDASLAVGMDGAAIGGQVAAELKGGAAATVSDYNFGAEVQARDLTASVWTEKTASAVNVGVFQKPSPNAVVGAVFKYDFIKGTRALQLGGERRVDSATTVRAKLDLPDGAVSAVVEQRVANPAVLLQVAAQFAAKPTLTAQKLGVTASFGDF